MIENSTQGLTLLDADLDVEVTGTEHHPSALRPRADGRARQVAAELAVVGDASGREWIEVRLDGVPVGTLAPAVAQRHARHIDAVLDRGGRPAALGLIRSGPHGPVLELRLPDPAAPVRAPLPPAQPPAARPGAFDPAERWPSERPTRRRLPVLIGAGVLALLVIVGVVIGTRGGDEPVTSAVRTAVPTATPTPTPTPSPTPTATPTPTTAAATPRPRTPRPSRTRAPAPTATPTPAPPVATATPTPPAEPSPPPPPSPQPDPDCDPLISEPDPDCAEEPTTPGR